MSTQIDFIKFNYGTIPIQPFPINKTWLIGELCWTVNLTQKQHVCNDCAHLCNSVKLTLVKEEVYFLFGLISAINQHEFIKEIRHRYLSIKWKSDCSTSELKKSEFWDFDLTVLNFSNGASAKMKKRTITEFTPFFRKFKEL